MDAQGRDSLNIAERQDEQKDGEVLGAGGAAEVTFRMLWKPAWELLDYEFRKELEYETAPVGWDKEIWASRRDGWAKRKEQHLRSIAERARRGELKELVVFCGYRGGLSHRTMYDGDLSGGQTTPFEVISTKPAGRVRITAGTVITIELSGRGWPRPG